ncbi:MAG: hypothetical protein KAT05_09920 [Spirochaetes bacterium]|nr:hypothetical protein [Spirochaetota bacterium]
MIKKTFTIFTILFILTMVGCKTLQPKSGDAALVDKSRGSNRTSKNLLLNSSFEDEDPMKYWKNYGDASFNWTTDWHHYDDGKWSFGVGNDTDWAQDNMEGGYFQIIRKIKAPDKLFEAKSGKVLIFKMKVKIEADYAGKASLKLEFYDYDVRKGFMSDPLKSYQSEILSEQTEDEWKELTVQGKAPNNAVSLVVRGCSEEMALGSKFIFFDEGYLSVK